MLGSTLGCPALALISWFAHPRWMDPRLRRYLLRQIAFVTFSVGLMFPSCDVLPGFTHIAKREQELSDLTAGILNTKSIHVRLQDLPLEKAQALWDEIGEHEIWR